MARMSAKTEYKEQLGKIGYYITEIGDKYGAREGHFKHERMAEALPPPSYMQPGKPNKYGIRLYCIRLSTEIVILLNGDMKTANNPEDCPNCRTHFHFANALSKMINAAILEKDIVLRGMEMQMDDDFEIEV